MLKRFCYVMYALLCLSMTSCEEIIEIDAPDFVSNAIVFQGVVTNERPPYFFRLTRPVGISEDNKSYYQGIDDAMVVVTDVTEGVRDTMKLIKGYPGDRGIYYDYYNYDTEKNEHSEINGMYEYACNGMYVTTKIYGIEGHSYSLDIYYDGKHFESDVQKMEPALVITDLKSKKVDLGEKGIRLAPCISFLNPPGDNYYLFYEYAYSYTNYTLSRPAAFFAGRETWLYSILSDKYLEENVVDFIIDDGENPLGYPSGWNYVSGDSLYVWAQTISKSCYDVFDQMIMQFRTDGGAYTPTPTSIKGNISGGVYGCFRVSAASEKWILAERN